MRPAKVYRAGEDSSSSTAVETGKEFPTFILSILSGVLRKLRRGPVSRSLVHRVWNITRRTSPGTFYFFNDKLNGNTTVHGGVCGITDSWLDGQLSEFEPETVKAVARRLQYRTKDKKGKNIFLDIGANCGQWLLILKCLDTRASVHCFEPFPQLADFLCELSKNNRYVDVHVVPYIVGAETGEGTLFFNKQSPCTASVFDRLHAYFDSSVVVPKITIDEYVAKSGLTRVDLMKIDVELGELEVIEGANETLEKSRPDVVIEVLHTEDETHVARKHALEREVIKHGYDIFKVLPNGDLTRQDCFDTDPSYQLNNFLLIHKAVSTSC